jgi:hypothetical protein
LLIVSGHTANAQQIGFGQGQTPNAPGYLVYALHPEFNDTFDLVWGDPDIFQTSVIGSCIAKLTREYGAASEVTAGQLIFNGPSNLWQCRGTVPVGTWLINGHAYRYDQPSPQQTIVSRSCETVFMPKNSPIDRKLYGALTVRGDTCVCASAKRHWNGQYCESQENTISLTGPTETRPTGTGGASSVTITAKVTSGGLPKAGVSVGFGVAVQPQTGGHTHGDLGSLARPKGKLSIDRGVTDVNGEIKFKFIAPEPSGLHAIVADCSAAGCAAQATHIVTVKVPDLIHIPPDYANTPARYTLVGNYGDGGNAYQHFNHVDTQFLSDSAWEALDELIDTFIELGWGQVGINDTSLEWGGMFDISGKWLEPILNSKGKYTTGGHAEHRDGQQADISFTRPASISNALRQKVFDEVCDGDGSALPPATLWHQNDDYAPHFHIYLTGKKTSGAKAQCSKK